MTIREQQKQSETEAMYERQIEEHRKHVAQAQQTISELRATRAELFERELALSRLLIPYLVNDLQNTQAQKANLEETMRNGHG